MEEEIWRRELLFFSLVRLILHFDDNVFKTLEFFSSTRTIHKNPLFTLIYGRKCHRRKQTGSPRWTEHDEEAWTASKCYSVTALCHQIRFASELSLYGSHAQGPSEISLYLANVVICRKRTNSRLLVNHLYNNLEKQTSAITSAGHFIIPEEKIQEQSSNVVEDNTYLHISKLN